MQKLEHAYLAEAVRASASRTPEQPLPRLRRGEPLRKIVFIGDIMWEANFLLPEFARIAEVESCDLRPRLKGAPNEELRRITLEAVEQFLSQPREREPDVVLLYARAPLLSDELFDVIRRKWSCPLLGMNLDDKVTFLPYALFSSGDDDYQRWAKKFDLNLSNCRVVTDWYKQRGLPVVYFPHGVLNEHLPPPDPAAKYKYELSFLGSIKPEREIVINRLIEAGVPVSLFGAGWPNTKWVESPTQVYRSSQINLGIGFATPSLTTIKGRDFECPGVGACYLTTYNWELAEWFDIGREILLYRCVEELIEIFSYYRQRPEACARIAIAAFERCMREHTWEIRFRKLFREIGFAVY